MSTTAGRPPNCTKPQARPCRRAQVMPRSSAAVPRCRPRCSKTGKSRSTNVFRPACPTRAPPVPQCDHELHDGDVLDFGGGARGPRDTRPHRRQHRDLPAAPRRAVHRRHHRQCRDVMLGVFNQDRAQTVASFKRLAALDVETACFGHGEPIASRAGDSDPRSGCHTDGDADMIDARHQGLDLGDLAAVPGVRIRRVRGAPHRGRRPHPRRRRRLGAQARRDAEVARAAHGRRCGRRWSTAATSATSTGSSTTASG